MVVEGEKKLIGVFSKSDILRPTQKKIVLVDHNEISQAVDGATKLKYWKSLITINLETCQVKNLYYLSTDRLVLLVQLLPIYSALKKYHQTKV